MRDFHTNFVDLSLRIECVSQPKRNLYNQPNDVHILGRSVSFERRAHDDYIGRVMMVYCTTVFNVADELILVISFLFGQQFDEAVVVQFIKSVKFA